MRQSFEATEISVSDPGEPLTVAFGTIDSAQGMTYSLIFMKGDVKGQESIYMEFNDQSNACRGGGLNSIELGGAELLVRLNAGARIRAGKVDHLTSEALTELSVTFKIPSELHLKMEAALRELLREGCGLSRKK